MRIAVVVFAVLLVSAFGFSQKEKEVRLNEETQLLEATYFHDNGEISQKGTFDQAGKLHGEWISYDVEGKKVSMGSYDRGVRSGKWFFWGDGTVKEVEFSNNTIASVIHRESGSGVVIKD